MYETDQDQVDALKRFWNDYGNWIIAAILAFLAAYFGVNYLQSQKVLQAENASDAYTQFQTAFQAQQEEQSQVAFDVLVSEYSDTAYVTLASLQVAKFAVESGDLEGAATELKVALANTQEPALMGLINYRLARVLNAQQKADDALAIIEANLNSSYESLLLELKGDILNAKGDQLGALTAWTAANQFNKEDGLNRPFLEYKLQMISTEAN